MSATGCSGMRYASGYVEETNPKIDLVVANNIAERSNIEFHDHAARNDVLMGGEVHDIVGLWYAKKGELRVCYVCEQAEDVLGVQLSTIVSVPASKDKHGTETAATHLLTWEGSRGVHTSEYIGCKQRTIDGLGLGKIVRIYEGIPEGSREVVKLANTEGGRLYDLRVVNQCSCHMIVGSRR